MPKKTYFNLKEEKRRHFFDHAVAEIANHSYHDMSISRLVKDTGIAKGSIYQYFENKADLYDFIVCTIADKKLEKLNQYIKLKGSFIEKLKELIIMGSIYDLDHLQYSSVLTNALKEKNHGETEKTIHYINDKLFSFMTDFIKENIKEGKINKKTDAETAAVLIIHIIQSIPELLQRRYSQNPDAFFSEKDNNELLKDLKNQTEILFKTLQQFFA